MATPWLRDMRRPGRNRGVRILSNNAERGSTKWGGLRPVTRAQRGIRRLMKTDPNNAQGTPERDVLLNTRGTDRAGASRGVSVMGHTESRRVKEGTSQSGGPKVIQDRSRNTKLDKR